MYGRSTIFRAAAVAFVGILGACSSANSVSSGSSAPGSPQSAMLPLPVRSAVRRPTLFVGSRYTALNGGRGSVAVYANGATTPAGLIDAKVDGPTALLVDGAGSLYVANSTRGDVTVYSATGQLTKLIGKEVREPSAMAFDSAGRLFVGSDGWITIYSAGSFEPVEKIAKGIFPQKLVFDRSDNLYVGSGAEILEYPRGAATPSRTISLGNGNFTDFAIDQSGTIYAATRARDPEFAYGRVLVIPPGASKASFEFAQLRRIPAAIGLDGAGNLYVLYQSGEVVRNANVTVYAPGSSRILRKIAKGIGFPTAMIVDPLGSVYVANGEQCVRAKDCVKGNVTIFAPNGTRIDRVIQQGIERPTLLAVGN
jgi:DNA-binding beta-propeller fold protein YncE